jgi:S-DNA-T family DNA segregation ATPase FtsK/SpoIIIE
MRTPPLPPTLTLPPEPEEERLPAIPVLGVLAPVGISLAIWMLTGSAMSLVFAALGPVVLVAGMLDGRLGRRRSRRANRRRYSARLAEVERSIEKMHDAERRGRETEAGSARSWLADREAAARRWRTAPEEPLIVSLGRVDMPSELRLTPESAGDEPPPVGVLRRRAGTLPDSPLSVDLRKGLGIIGAGVAAETLLRAVLLQAVSRLPPGSAVDAPSTCEAWLDALPHSIRRSSSPSCGYGIADGGAPVRVVLSEGGRDTLWSCETVVEVAAGAGAVLRHPDLPRRVAFRPEAVTRVEALAYSRLLACAAEGNGAGVPSRVPLRPLLSGRSSQSGGAALASLRCAVGAGAEGTVHLDLVEDGPHSVIGGTTGSGKSELLLSWVLALSAAYPPSMVNFLLLDFKGGATFSPLEALPHTVGVITDLQPAAARRVVQSIAAEVRFRERALAAVKLRSIEDGDAGLARLVIVIDEFAALAEQLPECHAVLSDVAARGRSLGMHLMLCTQRPAGVVRDALLANAGLRICLRVMTPEDSRALVGVPDAARLRRPGQAVVAIAADDPRTMQVAEADAALVAELVTAWRSAPVRRPWLPELPEVLDFSGLPSARGLVLGLSDLPEEQAQPAAVWDPVERPSMVILGAPGSGKSTALAAVAGAHLRSADCRLIWPRPTLPCLWDAVEDVLQRLESDRAAPALLLADDVDMLLAGAPAEHAQELAARLLRILREGRGRGVAVALTAARVPPLLNSAGALTASRLLLRAASREEHLLAGGNAAMFDPGAPPGRGLLDGTLMQVALAKRSIEAPPERFEPVPTSVAMVAVSTRQVHLTETLAAAGIPVQRIGEVDPAGLVVLGGHAAVALGSAEQWQSRWGLFRQLSAAHPVLLDGCSPAELRSLLGTTELPPPCSGRSLWLIRPGEPAVRAQIAVQTEMGS